MTKDGRGVCYDTVRRLLGLADETLVPRRLLIARHLRRHHTLLELCSLARHPMYSKQLIDIHGRRFVGRKGFRTGGRLPFRRWALRYQCSIQWSAAPITPHFQMHTCIIKKPYATSGHVSRHRMVAEHLGSGCILEQPQHACRTRAAAGGSLNDFSFSTAC
jgi:hypothetical protein